MKDGCERSTRRRVFSCRFMKQAAPAARARQHLGMNRTAAVLSSTLPTVSMTVQILELLVPVELDPCVVQVALIYMVPCRRVDSPPPTPPVWSPKPKP